MMTFIRVFFFVFIRDLAGSSLIELEHNGLHLIAYLIAINLLAIVFKGLTTRNNETPEIRICQLIRNIYIIY